MPPMPAAPHWPLPGELRMPLQIGHSALVEGTVAAAIAVNATALAFTYLVDTPGWQVRLVALALVVCTGLWIAFVWGSLSGCRASDLILGPAGLRVDGGPHHGLTLAWTALDPARCHVTDSDKRRPDDPIRGHELIVATTDGRSFPIAEAYQTEDREALVVALDEIRAVHGLAPVAASARDLQPAPAAVAAVDVLRCPGCGASLAPTDLSSVTCPMCQQQVPVPPAVRAHLAEDAALAREAEAARPLIRSLLDQPGASAANRHLLLALVLVFLAPLLGAALYAPMRLRGLGSEGNTVLVFLAGASLAVLVAVLTNPPFARRVALRACLIDLGARHDGGPRCRGCGAALPDQHASHALVRCPYCRCDNILGVDLRPWQAAARGRATGLRGLLDQRRVRLAGVLGDALLCLAFALAFAAWPLLTFLGAE